MKIFFVTLKSNTLKETPFVSFPTSNLNSESTSNVYSTVSCETTMNIIVK